MSDSLSTRCAPADPKRWLGKKALAVVALVLAGMLTPDVAGANPTGPDPMALSTAWVHPTVPPRCTSAQIQAGDITACIVGGRGSRGDNGFGSPPNPLVAGVRFDGWAYSGPPIAAWEREFVTSNSTTVAGIAPGRLRTHVAAAALFEGFLTEIAARGYVVRDATGYTFRCTSGSSGSCTGGSMSHHAWGLAIDINAGANPNRTYYRSGDTSACAQPVVTDFPKWVIDTAQRWGLFWGGYGWSSGGCPTPTSESDSIRRDAHHFEFNGTVADALTIARNNGAALRPMACFDIVTPQGADGTGCNLTGVPSARWRTPIPVSPPAGAAAAVVNVTTTGATGSGYVTVEPCTRSTSDTRDTSNNNYVRGRATANLAFVPVTSRTTTVCVWRATPVHTVVDVVGYIAAVDQSPGARLFQPVAAERLWDTRSSSAPADHATVIYPLDADAVVNLTVTRASRPGYATAGHCRELDGALGTSTSSVNYLPGEARANVAFAPATDGRGCVYAHRAAHVIVDIAGRLLAPPAGSSARAEFARAHRAFGITPIPARRILDTRTVCGQASCPRLPGRTVHRIPQALTSGAGVVNVTVNQPSAAGFVTVGDCAVLTPGVLPATSSVNHLAGATVANLAFVSSSSADLCVWSSSDAHVVIDLQAEMSASASLGILLSERTRAADTRGR